MYHELIREFYHLFNHIFPEKSWLFYVFEETSFRMIKYDTSKTDENLPEEIKFQMEDQNKIIYDLSELNLKVEVHQGISSDLFILSQ